MTKVEEAKAALWGQLVDSGELGEEDANVLLDNLVAASRQEGAALEHELIFNLIRASCCYPIDGDKLFSKTLPKTYGDALPIKEPK